MFQTKSGSAKRRGPLHGSGVFLWLDCTQIVPHLIYLRLNSNTNSPVRPWRFHKTKWRPDTLSLCVFFFLLRLMTITIGWRTWSSSPLLSCSCPQRCCVWTGDMFARTLQWSVWSQRVPRHLWKWFFRPEHNRSPMCFECIYVCTFT